MPRSPTFSRMEELNRKLSAASNQQLLRKAEQGSRLKTDQLLPRKADQLLPSKADQQPNKVDFERPSRPAKQQAAAQACARCGAALVTAFCSRCGAARDPVVALTLPPCYTYTVDAACRLMILGPATTEIPLIAVSAGAEEAATWRRVTIGRKTLTIAGVTCIYEHSSAAAKKLVQQLASCFEMLPAFVYFVDAALTLRDDSSAIQKKHVLFCEAWPRPWYVRLLGCCSDSKPTPARGKTVVHLEQPAVFVAGHSFWCSDRFLIREPTVLTVWAPAEVQLPFF